MTVQRGNSTVTFECDGCEALFEGVFGEDFDVAWPAAKRNGWRARKIGTEWVHECPDCQED